jgi:hypothetical protein
MTLICTFVRYLFKNFGIERENREESIVSPQSPSKESKSNGVRFEEYLSVILIPHRNEYKLAHINLWWSRMDFFKFQKLANSEIRLLSILQNISFKEAKLKLYQPEVDPEGTCWQYLARDPTPPPSVQSTPEAGQQTRKSLLAPFCLDIEADINSVQAPNSPVPRTRTGSFEEQEDKDRAPKNTLIEELLSDLHFCVPLAEKVMLIQDDGSRDEVGEHAVAFTVCMALSTLLLPLLGFIFLRNLFFA